MRTRILCFYLASSVALFYSFCVSADESADAELQKLMGLSIEELLQVKVTTSNKREQPIADATPTTIVISEDDIKNFAYRDLKDALKHTLGIEYGFPGSWLQGGQRGFGNNFSQTKLFVNGLENNLFWTGEAYNSNQYTLDNVKQIEIVFGPASTLYGADAFSGVINIKTKNASNSEDGVSVSTALGKDDYLRSSFSSIKTLGDLSLSFSGTYIEQSGPDNQEFVLSPEFSEISLLERQIITNAGKPYRDENRANNFNLDLQYQLSSREQLEAGIYWWKNRDGGGQEVAHLEFNSREEVRQQLHSYVNYLYEFENENTKFNLKYDRAQESDEISGPSTINPEGLNLPDGPTIRNFKVLDQNLDQLDLQVDHQWQTINNYLIGGYTYQKFDLTTPTSVISGVTSQTFPDNFQFLKQSKYSYYFLDQQNLLDDQLHLLFGWRLDQSNNYDDVITTRSSAYYKFNQTFGIKYIYGEAFQEPTLFELASNNNLQPSELKSNELVFLYKHGDQLSGQLSYFVNQASNLIEVDRTITPATASNRGVNEIKGIESRIKWSSDNFSGYFDASYAKNPNDTKLLNYAKRKYLVGVSHYFSDWLTLSMEAKKTSSVNTEIIRADSSIEVLTVPEYTVLDFTARKNPARIKGSEAKYELIFSVKNLLNKRNLFANIRGQNPYVFLDEGRSFYLELLLSY